MLHVSSHMLQFNRHKIYTTTATTLKQKSQNKKVFFFHFAYATEYLWFCIAMKMYFSLLNDRFNFQSSSKIRGILSAFNFHFVDRWYRIQCSV